MKYEPRYVLNTPAVFQKIVDTFSSGHFSKIITQRVDFLSEISVNWQTWQNVDLTSHEVEEGRMEYLEQEFKLIENKNYVELNFS